MSDVLQGPTVRSEQSSLTRLHVAVLFVDLSGFTALVESVEPEIVYARVRPLIDELVLLVRFNGGDIQQVLGDGFMAVFGLPGAGGQTAEPADVVARAVQAGMALACAGAGLPDGRLPVHVGIECGEVLLSESWEPARFAVWGRAVTVASRLCDLAGPGVVNIGPRAFQLGGRRVVERWGTRMHSSARIRPRGFTQDLLVHSVIVA